MISLKKNDKIIVIIAVIVLVAAGIGIAAYIPPKTEDIDNIVATNGNSYHVSWETHTVAYPLSEDFYAGKTQSYNQEITINQHNLLSVNFKITWQDDHTYGLLRKKGLDTLSVEIKSEGQTKNREQVGNGTMDIAFNLTDLPTIDSITADNLTQAQEKIQTEFYDETSHSFTVGVSVKTGEKIFRFLKYLRDKGNDFDLQISYTYFDGIVSETNDNTINTDLNGNQTPDDPWEPAYISMILNTGCGRYV
jgi:hypothetical protein